VVSCKASSPRNGNHLPFSDEKPNAHDTIGGSCKNHICAVSLGVAPGLTWDIGANLKLAYG